jgi:hypothetical protein
MSGRPIDISGQKFGKLIALEKAEPGKGGKSRWWCLCICGARKVVAARLLLDGASRSCGCSRRSQ